MRGENEMRYNILEVVKRKYTRQYKNEFKQDNIQCMLLIWFIGILIIGGIFIDYIWF